MMGERISMKAEHLRCFDGAIGAHAAVDATLLDRGLIVPFEQPCQHECYSLEELPNVQYAGKILTTG